MFRPIGLSLFLCILCYPLFAQVPQRPNLLDSLGLKHGEWAIFYDSAYAKVLPGPTGAFYYRLITFDHGKPSGKVRDFFVNGIKQWEGYLLSFNPDTIHGEATFYNTYGNVSTVANYHKGDLHGELRSFYDDGTLKSAGRMQHNRMNGHWEFYHANGQLETRGLYTNDKNVGEFTFYGANGKVAQQATYVDGKFSGLFALYHDNGNPKEKGTYRDGERNGFFEFYHENGQVSSAGAIKEGLYEDEWRFYHPSGRLRAHGYYLHDLDSGRWTYYYENGQVETEGDALNGQWHGHLKSYAEEGYLLNEGAMIDGKKEGEWVYYYPDGSIQSRVIYHNDVRDGMKVFYNQDGVLVQKGVMKGDSREGEWEFYYDNGQLEYKGFFKNDLSNGYIEMYWPNGNPKSKGGYVNSVQHGDFFYFFENGVKKSEGRYENGSREGTWTYYHQNGWVSSRGEYKNDQSVGHWTYFYDNGATGSEGEELDDMRMGVWRYYHPNGQLSYTGETVNGKGAGLWTYYDSLGRKTSEGYWKDDLKDSLWVYYHPNGQVESKGLNKLNYQHGEWQYYDSQGKLLRTDRFNNGLLINFENLYDSAFTLSVRRQVDELGDVLKLAKKEWREEFSKKEKGYHRYRQLLATVNKNLYDYDAAEKYYLQTLKQIKRIEGDTSYNYAYVLSDLAYTYTELSRYQEAVAAYNITLPIVERLRGKDNTFYLVDNRFLAYSYFYLGEVQRAANQIKQDLDYRLNTDGEPTYIALDLYTLADIYYKDTRYAEALKMFREVISYTESNNLEKDRTFTDALRFSGYIYDHLAKPDSARHYYELAIANHRKKQDTVDVNFLYNFLELADYHYVRGDVYAGEAYADTLLARCVQNSLLTNRIYPDALLTKAKLNIKRYNYRGAEALYNQAIKQLQSLQVPEPGLLSDSYQGLGVVQQNLYANDYTVAEQSFQKAMNVLDATRHNSKYTHAMYLLLELYITASQWHKGNVMAENIISYLQKFEREDEFYLAATYRSKGKMAYRQFAFEEALKSYAVAEKYYSKAVDAYYIEYAYLLSDIANIYEDKDTYKEATPYLIRALKLFEERSAVESADYVYFLVELAYHHRIQGNHTNAISLYRQALEKKERLAGRQSVTYLNTLQSLAICYRNNGQIEEARAMVAEGRSILASIKQVAGFEETDINFLEEEALNYSYAGNYQEAENAYKRLLGKSEKWEGRNSLNYAYYLSQLAQFYYRQGKTEKAMLYIEPSIEIVKRVYGTKSPKYAWYREIQSDIYFAMEKYKESLAILEDVQQVYASSFGTNSFDYISAFSDLASLYESLGRYDEAEAMFNQLLEKQATLRGKKTYYYVNALEQLAGLYRRWHKPGRTIEVAEEAISYLDSIDDVSSYSYLTFYNLMGLSYAYQNNIAQADIYLTMALEGATKRGGKESGDYFVYTNNLAFVKLLKGEYELAEKMYTEAAKRFDYYETVRDLDRVNHENNLAELYLSWGKLDKAGKYFDSVTGLLLNRITNEFHYMSEKQKADFWNAYRGDFENYNTYALAASKDNEAVVGQMYNNQIQTKSLLLSTSTRERRRILNSGDSTIIAKYFDYVSLKEQLVKYYGYSRELLAQERINLDSLESRATAYESELSLDVKGLAEETRNAKVKWEDIQRLLTPTEAAVEIVRFRYFDKLRTDSVIYAALILTSETQKSPTLVVLPNGNELEGRYYKSYRASIQFQQADAYSYAQYWAPIDAILRGKKTVYFSPDGIYNQLNVSAFRRMDGSYVLDDYSVTSLTSTRDMLALRGNSAKKDRRTVASLFGFPSYSLSHRDIETYTEQRGAGSAFAIERDVDLTRFGFSELKGTKQETEAISALLTKNSWEAQLFLGREALEEELKSVQSPRVLHIATHGFFLDDVDEGNDLQLGIETAQSKKNPLLRSGLLLAGAEETVKGNYYNQTENGIFTAYEAMNLQLNGTELVVLSACETGRGELRSGEGVYGLQRSFQIAGAEALIMSLWKVNDDATQMLMTQFYQNWLQGKSKKEAFTNAQLRVRETYDHPYYWGAFVMVGE